MSVLGALGLGMSAASGIFGAIKASKAAAAQKKAIAKQEAKNDAWYNNQYYQNYMDSTEAKSAMQRVKETLQRENADARAQAAVSGATPEAAVAQQRANQQSLENTATTLAGNATQRKNYVDSVNQANQQQIHNAQMQQAQADETGASQVMNNGLNLIGSALSMYDDGKVDKSLTKGGGVPATHTDASLSNPNGKIYYK